MALVSVTRLRLRAWRFLPGFALQAAGSLAQARRAPGFRAGALLRDRSLTFWTLTVWERHQDMRSFMAGGAHLRAMPRLQLWCDEASVVHWEQQGEAMPDWAEADRRMRAEGRPSRVRHPSPAHAALAYRPPRASGAVPITPA